MADLLEIKRKPEVRKNRGEKGRRQIQSDAPGEFNLAVTGAALRRGIKVSDDNHDASATAS